MTSIPLPTGYWLTRVRLYNWHAFDKPREIKLTLGKGLHLEGDTGVGKTTILDGLRLCLYGRLALGPRVREQDYKSYLRDRIHRNFRHRQARRQLTCVCVRFCLRRLRRVCLQADAWFSLSIDRRVGEHKIVCYQERHQSRGKRRA